MGTIKGLKMKRLILVIMVLLPLLGIAQSSYTLMTLDGRATDYTTSWIHIDNDGKMPQSNFIIQGSWANVTGTKDGALLFYGTIDPTDFSSGVLLQTINITAATGQFGIQLENRGWRAIKITFDINSLDSADVLIKTNMRAN